MASGIRVKRIDEPTYKRDGVRLHLSPQGRPAAATVGVLGLSALRPTARTARLERTDLQSYKEFRTAYWRELGAAGNASVLADLRCFARRSAGVTLLTGEADPAHSAEMALAELLDGENQRPGRSHYCYVYVVELLAHGEAGKPMIYVGDTGKSPEERFHDHVSDRRSKTGGRLSSPCVRRHGAKRLAYELFKHLNPVPTGVDACELAKQLRQELATKYEPCGSPECW